MIWTWRKIQPFLCTIFILVEWVGASWSEVCKLTVSRGRSSQHLMWCSLLLLILYSELMRDHMTCYDIIAFHHTWEGTRVLWTCQWWVKWHVQFVFSNVYTLFPVSFNERWAAAVAKWPIYGWEWNECDNMCVMWQCSSYVHTIL